jgi:hypothetical protein
VIREVWPASVGHLSHAEARPQRSMVEGRHAGPPARGGQVEHMPDRTEQVDAAPVDVVGYGGMNRHTSGPVIRRHRRKTAKTLLDTRPGDRRGPWGEVTREDALARRPRHRSRGTGVRRPRPWGMSVPWPRESAVSSFRSSDAATEEHATLWATAPGDLGGSNLCRGSERHRRIPEGEK